ncbi:host attachment protein [Parendozoicomonas sp. Alg238-R29]|uniref:host attachment protein n=1 Tax=Parendozoicomonas sp. Alg238-R29 TaxID=2993446 RepID=UPI00248DCB8D|nr:host attachment protein [Parendozoicomonas sp. Alg238-R29]
MRPIWVLVADNSQACMYNFHPHQHDLQLLDHIQHEEGRWHNGDFITDRTGHTTKTRSPDSMANRGLGTPDRSPKHQENSRFTHMIAKAINHAHDQHSFQALQVCAPPGFMGELLPKLKKDIPLTHKVNKNLVTENDERIMQHLSPQTMLSNNF